MSDGQFRKIQSIWYRIACLMCQSLAGQTPAYLADDIQLVTDTDRRPLRSAAAPGHALFDRSTTVSVTGVSVLQARVCGTACHRTYDKT